MTTVPASLLARLLDPHSHPDFMDGQAMCRMCGRWIEQCELVDGRFVCEREVAG